MENNLILGAIWDGFANLPTGTLVFLGIVITLSVVLKSSPRKRRRSSKNKANIKNELVKQRVDRGIADPKNQLEYVAKVGFTTQKLLNKEEYPVLLMLENVAKSIAPELRVMAQTSLGEIITTKKDGASKQDRYFAFRSINSKRLDFAVFDKTGNLVLAVEYQGSGHYRAKSFIRDAVKREVIRKAGVAYLEVPVEYDKKETSNQIRQMLLKALNLPLP
ncbi:hypothetical protein A9Q96_08885 [Rhodobacterales bacterium 52_120_T64]|nr:hypothetical protein A9Q96_08885 [Rhodobacterales bacterium 52_120_T64]